jgi:transcription elongation factor Elf1
MPLDKLGQGFEGDESDNKEAASARSKEFDCPSCNANNPYSEGFTVGDEIRCFYCGLEFRVEVRDDGRLRFREV